MKSTHLFLSTSLGISLIVALLWMVSIQPAIAISDLPTKDWTVCKAGPPTCDFDIIQDAIDAASDGDTINDCLVSSDGNSFCVRAERAGGIKEGRRYLISIQPFDGCGNTSAQGFLGYIYVPHSKRDIPGIDCIKTNDLGYKKHEPIPVVP